MRTVCSLSLEPSPNNSDAQLKNQQFPISLMEDLMYENQN